MKAEKFKRWISEHLPKEIKYLTAIDAIGRFGEDHDIN